MSQLYVNNIKSRVGGAVSFSQGIIGAGATFTGNVSIGGTLTYEDVTNVESVGIVTAGGGIRIGTGGTVGPVGSGIVTYYGDGSKLTGIDASSLQDSGGTVRVQANTSGAVVTGVLTATSFSGDGSGLTFTPKILAFDPAALSTEVAVDKTITITFDQNISFSGNGTVELRSGSAGGSVIQSFAISSGTPATGLSIVGTQLIINPSSDFAANTVVYVILPSTGIVNSVGSAYGGSNTYNFQTVVSSFSAQGGTEFTVADGSSPTGYYKYHVFSQSGILTTTAPAQSASDFDMMVVGGGGGGGHAKDPISPGPGGAGGGGGAGGYITVTQSNVVLSGGQYTVSIGSSGLGGYNSSAPLVAGTPGGDTTITPPSSPTTYLYRALGGGGGGGISGTNQSSGLPGSSGGGGSTPAGPPAGFSRTSGGVNTPGQGNSGAQGASAENVVPSSSENGRSAGGGGGAGGSGQAATALLRFYGPTGANPSDIPRSVGGAGGPGTPNPAFSSPKLSSSGLPADILNTIGPSGLYCGGGGGSATGPVASGGEGGSGGGGDGGNSTSLPGSILPYAPSTIAPGPYPSDVSNFGPHGDGKGFGAGGGGSYSTGVTHYAGSGYPGVVMIRYETPAP